jgi:gliding motility-associated lipoprotein GldH
MKLPRRWFFIKDTGKCDFLRLRVMFCSFCFLLTACVFTSCSHSETPCHSYQEVPTEGWEQQHSLTFNIDTIRKTAYYRVIVNVRTTNAYPFQSLWLLVHQQYSRPQLSSKDTVVCVFTDQQGNPLRHGISLRQYSDSATSLLLRKGQYGTVTVSHIMRRNILSGISDVGVEIRKE